MQGRDKLARFHLSCSAYYVPTSINENQKVGNIKDCKDQVVKMSLEFNIYLIEVYGIFIAPNLLIQSKFIIF